jgi:hypothetical protein
MKLNQLPQGSCVSGRDGSIVKVIASYCGLDGKTEMLVCAITRDDGTRSFWAWEIFYNREIMEREVGDMDMWTEEINQRERLAAYKYSNGGITPDPEALGLTEKTKTEDI